VIELGHVGDHRELVRYVSVDHVLRVEQAGDAELLLGDPEGQAVVVQDVARVETLHTAAQQAGPEVVNQGAEGDPVPPALVHVQDVHILIERSHTPAPDLQGVYSSLLSRHFES